MFKINRWQDFMPRGRPILLNTRMITDSTQSSEVKEWER